MKCERINIKNRKVCYGDLNRKIVIETRSIKPPSDDDDFDYGQEFTESQTVWATVQTTSGKDIFDGANMIGTATHLFFIKYISGLTSESMITWQNEKYRILRLENLDENNEFVKLYCNIRGTKDNEVNLQ